MLYLYKYNIFLMIFSLIKISKLYFDIWDIFIICIEKDLINMLWIENVNKLNNIFKLDD